MKTAVFVIGVALASGAGCKKSGGGGGGGGGGGTGWLVGVDGLMVNVHDDGSSSGYNAPSNATLSSIACRFEGEAWVAGANGTLLYTDDGGQSWAPQPVPTTADLRSVATQDAGPVFVVGNGVFLVSSDTGAHWAALGDGSVNFRSVAAAQEAQTVLAVGDNGQLFAYQDGALTARGSYPGARAVAVSEDGKTALLAGDNLLMRSTDGGASFQPLTTNEAIRYDDVRLDDDGAGVAVGSHGGLAHISAAGSVAIQHLGTADLHTIHLAYPDGSRGDVGFAAGDGGQVWMTRDGGSTWTQGPNAGRTVLSLDQIGEGHR